MKKRNPIAKALRTLPGLKPKVIPNKKKERKWEANDGQA